jgi:hypothetical protein
MAHIASCLTVRHEESQVQSSLERTQNGSMISWRFTSCYVRQTKLFFHSGPSFSLAIFTFRCAQLTDKPCLTVGVEADRLNRDAILTWCKHSGIHCGLKVLLWHWFRASRCAHWNYMMLFCCRAQKLIWKGLFARYNLRFSLAVSEVLGKTFKSKILHCTLSWASPNVTRTLRDAVTKMTHSRLFAY